MIYRSVGACCVFEELSIFDPSAVSTPLYTISRDPHGIGIALTPWISTIPRMYHPPRNAERLTMAYSDTYSANPPDSHAPRNGFQGTLPYRPLHRTAERRPAPRGLSPGSRLTKVSHRVSPSLRLWIQAWPRATRKAGKAVDA